jgi:hypothetical protein
VLVALIWLVPDWRIERADVCLPNKKAASSGQRLLLSPGRFLLGGLSSVDHFRVFAYLECRYPVHLGFIWVCFNIGPTTAIKASYPTELQRAGYSKPSDPRPP